MRTVIIILVVLVLFPTLFLALAEPAYNLGSPVLWSIWEVVLSVLSLISFPVQYIPQIRNTYKVKRADSLNITTLCNETTRWLILPFYYIPDHPFRPAVALFATCFPGILLSLAVYYEYILPRRQSKRGRNGLDAWGDEEEDLPLCAYDCAHRITLDESVKAGSMILEGGIPIKSYQQVRILMCNYGSVCTRRIEKVAKGSHKRIYTTKRFFKGIDFVSRRKFRL